MSDGEDLLLVGLAAALLEEPEAKGPAKPEAFKPKPLPKWERTGKKSSHEASLLLENGSYYLLEDGSSTILLE